MLEIDARDPAVLVVDRENLDRGVCAVAAPGNTRTRAAFVVVSAQDSNASRLVGGRLIGTRLIGGRLVGAGRLRQRVLLADFRQGIVLDAGQAAEAERVRLMPDEIEQQQRLRRRRVAADAQTFVLELLIAGVRDVARQFADASSIESFRRRHDEHPARIGRELGSDDPDVVAEIKRGRRAGRIETELFRLIAALRLLVVREFLQGRKNLQLLVAQVALRRCRIRILFRLDRGRRGREAGTEIMDEPIVADAKAEQPAVGRELRRGDRLRGSCDLREPMVGELDDKKVTLAYERRALAVLAVDRRCVGRRSGRALYDRVLAVGEIRSMQIDEMSPRAPGRVVHALCVHRPVSVLNAWPDPIRIRHDLLERERPCRRGRGAEQGPEQQREQWSRRRHSRSSRGHPRAASHRVRSKNRAGAGSPCRAAPRVSPARDASRIPSVRAAAATSSTIRLARATGDRTGCRDRRRG